MAHADVAQLVEHHLAKVRVAGSSPVVRSTGPLADRPGVSRCPVDETTCPEHPWWRRAGAPSGLVAGAHGRTVRPRAEEGDMAPAGTQPLGGDELVRLLGHRTSGAVTGRAAPAWRRLSCRSASVPAGARAAGPEAGRRVGRRRRAPARPPDPGAPGTRRRRPRPAPRRSRP